MTDLRDVPFAGADATGILALVLIAGLAAGGVALVTWWRNRSAPGPAAPDPGGTT